MNESEFGVEGQTWVAVEREPIRVYVSVKPGRASVEACVISGDDSLNNASTLEEELIVVRACDYVVRVCGIDGDAHFVVREVDGVTVYPDVSASKVGAVGACCLVNGPYSRCFAGEVGG